MYIQRLLMLVVALTFIGAAGAAESQLQVTAGDSCPSTCTNKEACDGKKESATAIQLDATLVAAASCEGKVDCAGKTDCADKPQLLTIANGTNNMPAGHPVLAGVGKTVCADGSDCGDKAKLEYADKAACPAKPGCDDPEKCAPEGSIAANISTDVAAKE